MYSRPRILPGNDPSASPSTSFGGPSRGLTISPDGNWVAWSYTRVRGDDTLHVVNLGSEAEHVVPLASGPTFSDDGNWVAYFVSLPFAEAEKARRDDDPVTRKAELLNLVSGEKRSWDQAASFDFAKGSSHFLVKKGRGDGGGAGGGGGAPVVDRVGPGVAVTVPRGPT